MDDSSMSIYRGWKTSIYCSRLLLYKNRERNSIVEYFINLSFIFYCLSKPSKAWQTAFSIVLSIKIFIFIHLNIIYIKRKVQWEWPNWKSPFGHVNSLIRSENSIYWVTLNMVMVIWLSQVWRPHITPMGGPVPVTTTMAPCNHDHSRPTPPTFTQPPPNPTTWPTADNLYTTQTPECTKDKYNVKIVKRKSLPRSHQQPM
jgi:hypothetical protein